MNIPENRWQKSEVGNHLRNFTGIIGQFTQTSTASRIQKVEKYLPFIFWRWFYLYPNGRDLPSPYLNLSLVKVIEDWPKNGQFLCIPQVNMKTENKLEVSLTVNYITFEEQPILVDLHNTYNRKPLKHTFGLDYPNDLRKLSEILKDQQIDLNNPKNLSFILDTYLIQTLLTWYKEDQVIQLGFSQKAWLNFWQEILKQICQTDYFDTQHILDPFIETMRQAIPDYGLRTNQLDINLADKPQYLSTLLFWVNLNRFLIIPFSLYSHLLAPNFMEAENFYEDIKDFLENDQKDATSLFCPATFISPTNFGKIVFAKL